MEQHVDQKPGSIRGSKATEEKKEALKGTAGYMYKAGAWHARLKSASAMAMAQEARQIETVVSLEDRSLFLH